MSLCEIVLVVGGGPGGGGDVKVGSMLSLDPIDDTKPRPYG